MARELDNAAPTIFAPTSTARSDTRVWADAYEAERDGVPELSENSGSGSEEEEQEEIDAYEIFGE